MRRQDQYLNSGADACSSAQLQQNQQMERQHAAAQFQGQLEAFTPERDDQFAPPKVDRQKGWDRDGPAPSNTAASNIFYEGQCGDASKSYYHSMRVDPRMNLEKQGDSNIRSQSHDREMTVGYEKLPLSQTFEGLEQKFLDDIMKLSKDLHDAEDAENARHREKLNAIDSQYQKRLESLRSRHASRRDEFLRRESNARQHQYKQTVMDQQYRNRAMDPQGYGNMTGSAPVVEAHRPYSNVDQYDSYGDRARFPGGVGRDQFEPRGSFPGGRAYDPSSHFY